MQHFHTLATTKLQHSTLTNLDSVAEILTLANPATSVMIDFTRRSPKMISKDASIDDAILIMRQTYTRTRIVASQSGDILGVVSMKCLQSRQVLMTAEHKGLTRNELTVADIMNKVSEIPAIKFAQVETAKIGDVLQTMRELGEHYLLVLDENSACRGLVCSSDIQRALQVSTQIEPKYDGFSEILSVLHNHQMV